MKLKIITLATILLSLSLLQQSCSKEQEAPACDISYKTDLIPITSTSCAGYCHNSWDHYSIYENIKEVAESGVLWEKLIETQEMPLYPQSITTEQREMFACWIEAGAPNN